MPPTAGRPTGTRETETVVNIDFIDWGNPLENINPIVGQRFPVEVALYEKLETPMTAYKMACLEYPGTKDRDVRHVGQS